MKIIEICWLARNVWSAYASVVVSGDSISEDDKLVGRGRERFVETAKTTVCLFLDLEDQ